MIYWEFHISLYLTFTSIEKHSITKISMKMWIIFAGLRSGGQCLIKYKFSLFVVMMQQHWTNLIGIFDKMSCMMWIQCWLMHLFRIWPHEKFYLLVCQPIYLFTAITLFWPYASYKSFWFIHWVHLYFHIYRVHAFHFKKKLLLCYTAQKNGTSQMKLEMNFDNQMKAIAKPIRSVR